MHKWVASSEHWLPRLLKVWAIFGLVAFAVMLMHSSDNPVMLGRYSTLVFAQLTSLLFLTCAAAGSGIYLARHPQPLSGFSTRLQRWRKYRWFAPTVMPIAGGLLLAVWLFFLGDHVPTYAFLRLFAGASIVVGALALLHGGSASQPVRWTVLPLMIAVGLVAAFAGLLPYFPALAKADEAFVFSMARNALENGEFRPTIYRQAFPPHYYGGLWLWMMAGWLELTNVSLLAGRAYILLMSIVSIGFLVAGTKKLYDRVTAWYVVIIGIYAFGSLNHIRFDIHTAFWLSLGIFCYSRAQSSNRWWWHIATGMAIGMCIDSNPVGYAFGIGLALVYTWEYAQVVRSTRRAVYGAFWQMAAGGGAALLIYLVIRSGGSFAGDKSAGDVLGEYIRFIQSNLVSGQFLSQIGQFFSIFLTNQPILFGLMVLGLLSAAVKRHKTDRFLCIMCGTWIAAIFFAFFYFPVFYMVLGLPLFVMLAARGAATGLPALIGTVTSGANHLTRTTSILLTIWLAAAIFSGVRQLASVSLEDVVETGRRMSQIVPENAVIVAAEPYYFGMLEHRQFTGGSIENLMLNLDGVTQANVWPQLKPDALIFSQNWPTEPARTPALMAYMTVENFGLRACYDTVSFGRIELWMQDAQAETSADKACEMVCNPRTGC